MDDTTTTTVERDESAPAEASTSTAPATEGVDEELLVEEVSIDGMCGVY